MPRIALIAHDEKKAALAEWVRANADALRGRALVCTATTGGRLRELGLDLDIVTVKSGPLGGDQQIGAMIATGEVTGMVFFTDPLSPHPHDVDVKALARLTQVHDIPAAFNRSTADLMLAGGF